MLAPRSSVTSEVEGTRVSVFPTADVAAVLVLPCVGAPELGSVELGIAVEREVRRGNEVKFRCEKLRMSRRQNRQCGFCDEVNRIGAREGCFRRRACRGQLELEWR